MKTILEYLQSGHLSNELDYVDLGLPSGTLWAKMNIGATKGKNPEDWYGLYFAWGETKGYKASDKHVFNWDTYKFGTQDNLIKYNKHDKLKKLEDADDAAYQYTNGEFRMPTIKELEELYKYTDQQWITDYNEVNGLNGILCTSQINKNKYIFIPAAGYCGGSNIYRAGISVNLWSSILFKTDARYASFINTDAYGNNAHNDFRYCGFTVCGILNT